jgi:hypothetical protein
VGGWVGGWINMKYSELVHDTFCTSDRRKRT